MPMNHSLFWIIVMDFLIAFFPMTKLKKRKKPARRPFFTMPILSVCVSHLLEISWNRSNVNLCSSQHLKCWRLACCISLASTRVSPFCRSAPLLSAAAAACAAKLALFPTVILSAPKQSPFGTAGCHGTRSILPTGTELEHIDCSVWQETQAMRKFSAMI